MLLGLLALLISQIFASTVVPIGTKISAPFAGIILFIFLRFLVSTALLFVLYLFSPKRKMKIFDYKEFAFLGFLLSINVVLFTFGIADTTVIMSSLIYSLTPILVGIAGHFFLNEPLDRQKILGLIIAFIGFLFLVDQSLSHYQQNAFGKPLGNILIFVAMLGYSYYVIQSRKVVHTKNHLPIQTTFLTFFFITLYMLLALFFGLFTGSINIKPLPNAGVLGLLIVGVGSVLQYLLLQIGIKKTTAFTASLFQYIGPFITAAVTIPFLHEQVTLRLFLGGLLVLSGVFIATTYDEFQKNLTKS